MSSKKNNIDDFAFFNEMGDHRGENDDFGFNNGENYYFINRLIIF